MSFTAPFAGVDFRWCSLGFVWRVVSPRQSMVGVFGNVVFQLRELMVEENLFFSLSLQNRA